MKGDIFQCKGAMRTVEFKVSESLSNSSNLSMTLHEKPSWDVEFKKFDPGVRVVYSDGIRRAAHAKKVRPLNE